MQFEDMLKVGAAAIVRRTPSGWQLLAARRTEPPMSAGLWEFPGGKVEADETVEQCVHREILEELGVPVVLHEPIVGPLHGFWPLGDRIAIALWWCSVLGEAEPAPIEDHDALTWLGVDALRTVPWIPADLAIVDAIEPALRRANRDDRFPHGITG